MRWYLEHLEEGLQQVAKTGIHPQVDLSVRAFMQYIRVPKEEDIINMSAAFGIGVMLATALHRPEVLTKPDLLRLVGLQYTAAYINVVCEPPVEAELIPTVQA